MARSVLVDAGFLVALLSRRDANHHWAAAQAPRLPPPWKSCDAALSEAFQLLGVHGTPGLAALLSRRAVVSVFHLGDRVGSPHAHAKIRRVANEPRRCLPRSHDRG